MSTNFDFAQAQIADLHAKIRDHDQSKEVLMAMLRAAEKVAREYPQAANDGVSGVSTGFREAIRQALRNRPEGLRPKDIVQDLRSSGELSKYGGKVALSVRVNNELYSLRKKDEVVKKGKLYRLRERGPYAFVGIPVKQ